MKKKILFTIHGLSIGGAEHFLISLLNQLDRKYFDILLISFSLNNPQKANLEKNIRFIELGRRSKFDIQPVLKLRTIIKKEKPDSIFNVGFFSFFLTRCATLMTNFKGKSFISYHTTEQPSLKASYLLRFYIKFIKSTDLILTVSDNQAKYTSEKYGVPSRYFNTIHNGVDLVYWRLLTDGTSRSETRKHLHIPLDAKTIAIIAGLRKEKNHIGAIKALKILHREYGTPAYLLLVGDGPERNSIVNEVNSLGLSSYVKIVGFKQDVRPYYWASDICSLTSLRVETFSVSALESMACGIPVVLTNIGGASEMVCPGINGFLSEKNEHNIAKKWHQALTTTFDKERIHNLISEKFSLLKMTQAYTKLLR